MSRNSLVIVIIWLALLAGCNASGESGRSPRIDTSEGMIEYLEQGRLPALRSVEKWYNRHGPGLKLTTDHYEIYTTLLEPLMLGQVPGFVESAYRGYQSQLPEPIETTSKFTIYLFADRDQWENFTETFTGEQSPIYLKIKAGGYYLNGACVSYNVGRERTFSVLGHEGWHQFNSRHFKFRLPSWLDEGIAMQFEQHRSEQGLFYFESSRNMYRLGDLKKTLMIDNMIPLEKLIAMNPGEAMATNKDMNVTAFYGQSYALVRFLREEDYGRRLGNYHQLLLGGLEGKWHLTGEQERMAVDRNIPLTIVWNRAVGQQLFREYICDEDDFDQIEKEYVTFCRKIVYHVHFR